MPTPVSVVTFLQSLMGIVWSSILSFDTFIVVLTKCPLDVTHVPL